MFVCMIARMDVCVKLLYKVNIESCHDSHALAILSYWYKWIFFTSWLLFLLLLCRYYKANSVGYVDPSKPCNNLCRRTHFCVITNVDQYDYERCIQTVLDTFGSVGQLLPSGIMSIIFLLVLRSTLSWALVTTTTTTTATAMWEGELSSIKPLALIQTEEKWEWRKLMVVLKKGRKKLTGFFVSIMS